ncbi:MAG: GrpB domain, predicted nucleotidyltransferase, family [Dehalococcoidia bacterium]|nr:GrpB domain, predicted nucleotidyltransferase, family [Dehalococcoidia bacterium]
MRESIEAGNMRWNAVLLVGPTGSGKTPLGQLLEDGGLWGRRCLHFDFGEALRVSAGQRTGPLTVGEREVVETSLRSGRLLEDEHFSIAEKLLVDYLTCRRASQDTVIVLNGLPRHVGQAKGIERIVGVQTLVSLECGPEVVWERIRTNTGGDRSGRGDETLEAVSRRLETFRMRTAPLLEHYRCLEVPVLHLEVDAKSTAQELRKQLDARWSVRSR